jgi:hypothetical protein
MTDESDTTDTNTTDDPEASHDHLRNDPSGTFAAHLFRAADVHEAGGEPGAQVEHPIASICSRTTSYGPFREVDAEAVADGLPDHDGDLCDACRDRRADAEAETDD